MSKIIERAKAPTPKFFKVLRNIGLIMAGVGTVLLTPVVDPKSIKIIKPLSTLILILMMMKI